MSHMWFGAKSAFLAKTSLHLSLPSLRVFASRRPSRAALVVVGRASSSCVGSAHAEEAMGAEQSSPVKGSYQPDFFTAHVRKISSELAPTQKRPLQGKSSVGADSLLVSSAVKAQEAVAPTPTNGTAAAYIARPAIDADSLYIKEMRSISATIMQPEKPQPLHKPTVGADSIYIRQATKSAQVQKMEQRNRFALADGKGKEEMFKAKGLDRNHADLTAFETAFAMDVKKHTKGKTGHMGLLGSPDKGEKTKIENESYYVKFGKETHSWLAPKSVEWEQWRGIKPHTPAKDYVQDDVSAKKEKINDAARVRAMPTPQVGPDAYEIQHAKRQAFNTSVSPIRGGGGAAHNFDAAEAFFTASPAVVKDAPENYQGIKPNVGADSYMMEHAKEAAEALPSAEKSREMARLPPTDPDALPPMQALEA